MKDFNSQEIQKLQHFLIDSNYYTEPLSLNKTQTILKDLNISKPNYFISKLNQKQLCEKSSVRYLLFSQFILNSESNVKLDIKMKDCTYNIIQYEKRHSILLSKLKPKLERIAISSVLQKKMKEYLGKALLSASFREKQTSLTNPESSQYLDAVLLIDFSGSMNYDLSFIRENFTFL